MDKNFKRFCKAGSTVRFRVLEKIPTRRIACAKIHNRTSGIKIRKIYRRLPPLRNVHRRMALRGLVQQYPQRIRQVHRKSMAQLAWKKIRRRQKPAAGMEQTKCMFAKSRRSRLWRTNKPTAVNRPRHKPKCNRFPFVPAGRNGRYRSNLRKNNKWIGKIIWSSAR